MDWASPFQGRRLNPRGRLPLGGERSAQEPDEPVEEDHDGPQDEHHHGALEEPEPGPAGLFAGEDRPVPLDAPSCSRSHARMGKRHLMSIPSEMIVAGAR